MLISVLSNKAVLGLGIELLYVWFEVPSQSDSLFVVNLNSKEGGGYNPWFQYNNHSSSSRHFYPQNSLTIINIRVWEHGFEVLSCFTILHSLELSSMKSPLLKTLWSLQKSSSFITKFCNLECKAFHSFINKYLLKNLSIIKW